MGTGDIELAKEVYWKINAEIEKKFNRARRSLSPHDPKPLTSEMARLFVVEQFLPKIQKEVESAQDNIGVGNLQEQLAELYEDEAHLTTGADEVLQPGLQATADEILIENAFPTRDRSPNKSTLRKNRHEPNVDKRLPGYWKLVNYVQRAEIEILKQVRAVFEGQPLAKLYDRLFSSAQTQVVTKPSAEGFSGFFRSCCIHLHNVENPTFKSFATCLRVSPLVSAIRTASCLNSSVRFVPKVVLLLRIIRG